jgi:Copper transport outer membrane protein, MctB
VDDIDRTAGKVALVYALAGASGHFGVKDTADSLLPDLLTDSAGQP